MTSYQLIRLSWRDLQPGAQLTCGEDSGALRPPDPLPSEVTPGAAPLHEPAIEEAVAAMEDVRRRGRTPVVVLHAGDLPAALAAAGWAHRGVAEAFASYARQVVTRLHATHHEPALWITVEDPWQIAFGVYQRPQPATALAAAHHLNLAHGLAALAMREAATGAQIGLALRLHVPRAADPERAADLAAAHRVALYGNHVFLGPVLDGSYPVELRRRTREVSDWSFVRPGDLVAIRQHLDLLVAVHRPPVSAREVQTGTIAGSRAGWLDLDDVDMVVHEAAQDRAEAYYDLLTALDNAYDGHPMLAMAGADVRDPAALAALEEAVARARTDGAAVTGQVLAEGAP